MQLLLDSLVTAVSAVIVAAYIWSVRGHFASEGMPSGARLIAGVVTLNTIVLLALTWFVEQPAWAQLVGVVVQLASGVLFIAAIRASRQAKLKFVFDPEHPHGLVNAGPYGYVRHPFYVSYIIFWAGWSIATWSPIAVLGLVVLVVLYIRAARMEEANFAASPLAADYSAYKSRVGFFWPRFG